MRVYCKVQSQGVAILGKPALFKFLLRRILFALLAMWIVATLTFILIHKLPGDPFNSDKMLPDRIAANLKARYQLDRPLYQQYAVYISNLLRGDLGVSMIYVNKSVNSIIASAFPVSLELGLRALFIVVAVGLLFGILSALNRGRWPDYLILIFAVAGVSIPAFISGALIQYFVCYKLSDLIRQLTGSEYRLLPVMGWLSFKHTIAPSIALALGASGIAARMMRASVLEVMGSEYIVAAKAKGLDRSEIVSRHVIRNAVLPLISVMGPLTTGIIMGSFVIENIFSVPGLGQYLVTSVQGKDYTMVTGLAMFTVFLTVIINSAADIAYALVDPRVRLK